ncbi:universal stress protein [Mycobacterium sp. MBM]|nr:universal stress protein [Mycobacterium sp. MBM]
MTRTHPPAAVVVGIDDSAAALHAAEWAVEEAVDRAVRLRLVHVVEPTSARAQLSAAAHLLCLGRFALCDAPSSVLLVNR